MLSFDEFVEYLIENIAGYISKDFEGEVTVTEVKKNNQTSYKALQIKQKGALCSPSVPLDQSYNYYLSCDDLEKTINYIADFHNEHVNDIDIDPDDIYNFDIMKDKIILRLVNYEKNIDAFKDKPHMLIEDLLVVFRWIADYSEMGVSTAIVTNYELESWGITIEELYQRALINTAKYFPLSCDDMAGFFLKSIEDERIKEKVKEEIEYFMEDKAPMFVLSNEKRINGATSILYPKCLNEISKIYDGDFYLLPSSVHEVILVPKCFGMDEDYLRFMVKNANDSVVKEADLLSYNVYEYNARLDSFKVV
ncbi:MAG: DUF5688 family protein [Lachnospiraceae bacterium]|nr:DUF5688 family protein [Lachnospiraceae bacterium]